MNMLLFSKKAFHFCDNWLLNIKYINHSTKAIKKVQHNCCLMQSLFQNKNIIYKGYIIDNNITETETETENRK